MQVIIGAADDFIVTYLDVMEPIKPELATTESVAMSQWRAGRI